MYEVLQRYFKNDADAKVLVEEIEQAIEVKFEEKKDHRNKRKYRGNKVSNSTIKGGVEN